MSNNTAPKGDTKNVVIVAIIAAVIAVGGYLYYKQTQTETVSMNIGGKEISATFEK